MKDLREKRVLILGVGNTLMRDDGAGVRVVEYLNANCALPDGVDCVDGGTAGLGLLQLMHGYTDIIIIDAVNTKNGSGSVSSYLWDEISKAPPARASAHGIGVSELLTIAGFDGLTARVVLIGIEPEETGPGMELTEAVQGGVSRAARVVLDELERLGCKVA